MTGQMRTFDTGATRDQNADKISFEGFLSPAVLLEYGRYMHKHRRQSDGSMRAADNWQKGIPQDAYMDSMWRHFFDVWALHRNAETVTTGATMRDSLTALMFNVMGYLHEELKADTPASAQTVASSSFLPGWAT